MFEIITVDELIKRLAKYNHKELHIHHCWKPNHEIYYNKPDGIYWQEAMASFHINTNGWSDIAQHVTLLPDGRFATGRNFGMDPASITGYNNDAFAVEMIGDFDIGNDVLEGRQRESIIGLSRWFDNRGKYIRFHRENSSKTCPGTSIDKTEFMNEVKGVTEMLLKQGTKGAEVKKLQADLTTLGYDTKGVDGIFGSGTQIAVIAFQKDNKLSQDGIVGVNTQRFLASAMTAPRDSLAKENDALRLKIIALNNTIGIYQNKLVAIKNIMEGK